MGSSGTKIRFTISGSWRAILLEKVRKLNCEKRRPVWAKLRLFPKFRLLSSILQGRFYFIGLGY